MNLDGLKYRTIVLDMSSTTWADFTGAQYLLQICESLQSIDISVAIADCGHRTRSVLQAIFKSRSEVSNRVEWYTKIFDAVIAVQVKRNPPQLRMSEELSQQ